MYTGTFVPQDDFIVQWVFNLENIVGGSFCIEIKMYFIGLICILLILM